jgi:hypothetical protein
MTVDIERGARFAVSQPAREFGCGHAFMRNSKPFNIKRRVFVYEADVLAYLERQKKQ